MERIRKCKTCGSEVSTKIGLHNWKNLFRKPTIDDYITLLIIFMALFSYYQYSVDIDSIVEYYEGGNYCTYQLQLNNPEININPLDNLSIKILGSLNESNGG